MYQASPYFAILSYTIDIKKSIRFWWIFRFSFYKNIHCLSIFTYSDYLHYPLRRAYMCRGRVSRPVIFRIWAVPAVIRFHSPQEIFRKRAPIPISAFPWFNLPVFSVTRKQYFYIEKKENSYLHLHFFMLLCIWWRLGILWNPSGKIPSFSLVFPDSLSESTINWF